MPASHHLRLALLELVGNGSLKQRLVSVYSKHLKQLDSEELPDVLREDYRALCAQLEAVKPLPGETAVQATVRKMSAEQADRCAVMVVALATDYAREALTMSPRAAREPRNLSETVVPLFAVEA